MNDTFGSITSLSKTEKILYSLVAVLVLVTMTFPQIVKAQSLGKQRMLEVTMKSAQPTDLLTKRFEEYENRLLPLPIAPKKSSRSTIKPGERYVMATAYSSTVGQTDSTPCITANGFNVCQNDRENVIAANFLPFGTKVKIPDLFGDRVFVVQDRMNRRYYYRIDFWMTDRSRAINFGKRYVKIQVVD